MAAIEKMVNRPIVKALFKYYGGKGSKRVDELFGGKKEKSLAAFIGRIPTRFILNKLTNKIGLDNEMKSKFFTGYYNRQTLMNLIKSIGINGLKQPFRFTAPLVIVWNYTNLCNLRCRYCYQSAGKTLNDELSYEKKVELINQMAENHVAYLAFSGGEPIMGNRFWDILSCASKFMHTSIATNGTLLGDKTIVNRIADCGARNTFVSLDGATAESHDYIRGAGNFGKTIKGIENLVANEHLHVGINTVVTRRNYHEVGRILELAKELGVNSFSHYNFIPTGRGRDDFKNDLTPEEREDLLNMLYEWHMNRKETKLNIISTAPGFARVISERSSSEGGGLFHYTGNDSTSLSGVIKYAGGCGAGRVYASMQPNGLVGPCVFMPQVVIGDTRKDKLIDIWRNSDLCYKLSDRENHNHKCSKFQYICGGCRARALAYGDILGPDPGCIIYSNSVEEHEIPASEKERELMSVEK
jgi:MoaA/NifB/PqqE/SkfB family radical SAM enzyme